MLSEKMNYCQYYLLKCKKKVLSAEAGKWHKTTDSVEDAFKNSPCYLRNPAAMNLYLIHTLSDFITNDAKEFNDLDIDAKRVLDRSIDGIANARTNEDIFKALSDYLWVKASGKLCSHSNKKSTISLTDNFYQEVRETMEWLEEIALNINNAKYDLYCMKEVDNLPFGKRILLGLIENPDVAWYANPDNPLYYERDQRIKKCERYIKELEAVYYSFLVTNIYKDDLRKRY